MYGPCPAGHWTVHQKPENFGPLKVGIRYRVAKAFVDHCGDRHEVGEAWTFLGHSFLPYEDGLSLFVSLDGAQEWHIPLQWRGEEQADVIVGLSRHVRPLPGQLRQRIWATFRYAPPGV